MELPEEIDWSDVQHAYGPAGDLPALFDLIRTAPADRDEAINDLWSALCHQETIYEASAVAVPTLFSLAQLHDLSVTDRTSLLMLVVYIGRGDDTAWEGHVSWETVERCSAAVEAIVPKLEQWARSTPEPAVRAAALAAATYFPASLAGDIRTIVPDDADPRLLAARRLLMSQIRGDLTNADVLVAASIDEDVADFAHETASDDASFRRSIILELAFAAATA
ncbi:hypothetical protein [Patulibacter minatonensis]|uniref:hypothetical protein n=1 Tax=Patulibacter minatonensis TaxID=298163 RepID=UPI0012F72F9C|nr:hypothetical protein [Patulibacter minatonensis]